LPTESATAAVGLLASGGEAVQEALPASQLGSVGFYLALFAGCAALAAVAGMLSSWIDRKVTALVQARVGPPLFQPLWDLRKLMTKETLIPEGANRLAFVLMPLAALAAVALAATILVGNILWQNGLFRASNGLCGFGMIGDLIVVLYLLAVPSLALVIGASSSNNPFASVGASREMKLMSYELPLLLAVAAALTLASVAERRYARELQVQVDAQVPARSALHSVSGTEGPVAASVPLRFDRLLLMRSSGPDPAEEALGKLGGARVVELAGRIAAELKAAADQCQQWGTKYPPRASEIRQASKAGLVLTKRQQDALERGLRDKLEGAAQDASDQARALQARARSALVDGGLGRLSSELDAVAGSFANLAQGLDAAAKGKPDAESAAKSLEDAARRGAGLAGHLRDMRDAVAGDGARFAAARVAGAPLARAVRWDMPGRLAELLALALCVIVAVMCAQAKLGLVPFDCAEAETEIAGGVLIEYGGPLLAAWKLTRQMLLFLLPVFIGVVFLGGFRFYVPEGSGGASAWQAVVSVIKYVAILVVFVLVRNTNPRVRIDQAMRFFLGPMSVLAVLALLIAVFAHFLLGRVV